MLHGAKFLMEITEIMIAKGSRREVIKHFQTKNGNT